jgi:hypothetical protein
MIYLNVFIYFTLVSEMKTPSYTKYLKIKAPRVVTGEKNSPTVAHACHKRRLKWVLSAWEYNWATQFPGDINMETGPPGWGLEHRTSNPVSIKRLNAIETSTIVRLLRPYVPVGTKRTTSKIKGIAEIILESSRNIK